MTTVVGVVIVWTLVDVTVSVVEIVLVLIVETVWVVVTVAVDPVVEVVVQVSRGSPSPPQSCPSARTFWLKGRTVNADNVNSVTKTIEVSVISREWPRLTSFRNALASAGNQIDPDNPLLARWLEASFPDYFSL
jgi:hypothetical protein